MLYDISTHVKLHKPKQSPRKQIRGRSRPKRRIPITSLAVMVLAASAKRSHKSVFDTDSAAVGIDNRASGCFSHVVTDFVGPLRDCHRVVKGFAGSRTSNVKMGTLKWSWENDKGVATTHLIPNSYFSKVGGVRLLSPQHFAQHSDHPNTTGTSTNATSVVLRWNQDDFKTIPLDRDNNVATFYLSHGYQHFNSFCMQCGVSHRQDDEPTPIKWQQEDLHALDSPSITKENDSWTPSKNSVDFGTLPITRNKTVEITKQQSLEAELLQIHYNLGHIHPDRMKLMIAQNILPRKYKNVRMPFCAACAHGKATRCPWRSRTSNNKDDCYKPGLPGELVAVDQLTSPTPGFIAQMVGILTTKRYTCATIYVDVYSGYSFVWIQRTSSASDTLEGKRAFEAHSKASGVNIQHYHADNGIFKANAWVQNCCLHHQRLTFAGVGAHHQNGVAERRIRLLQDMTRTQLAHANHRWSFAVTANLWPYAMRLSNNEWNDAPNPRDTHHRSPSQLFHNTSTQRNTKHSLPFACPVYVLNDDLQARRPAHKWRDRTRLGLYLGRSPVHARNVSLVLNLHSGHVSPQFHCYHDIAFDSVRNTNDKDDQTWLIRAGFVRKGNTNPHTPRTQREHGTTHGNLQHHIGNTNPNTPRTQREHGTTHGNLQHHDRHDQRPHVEPGSDATAPATLSADNSAAPLPAHLNPDQSQVQLPLEPDPQFPQITDHSTLQTAALSAEIVATTQNGITGEVLAYLASASQYDELHSPLLALKASTDPDTMYHHEAMRQPDAPKFIEAMNKELTDQTDNGNFEVVHIDDVPKGTKVLPAVWQMKRKRDIRTGTVKKYKARLNLDGSRMKQGRDYNLTYAPVATWNAIRLLLSMVLIFKWHTIQLDYVLAFPQAPIERELFMKIPAGVTLHGKNKYNHVLRCKKNIYGQKQAGRVWHEFLVKKLKSIGFRQSQIDHCIFYKDGMIYALYTDDSILAGPNRSQLEETIVAIKRTGLNLTIEGDLADFLGIQMDRRDNTIHMSQPHLIKQIMHDLRFNESNVKGKPTPMVTTPILHRNTESTPHDDSFHYRSLVGKLNYLEKGSRPDIAYAVHQCARFSSAPKHEHAQALRHLVRYLSTSSTMGTIIKPDITRGLEVHVDADFAGNWNPLDTNDVDTARSRHGYVITYANCPICWKSQLQQQITLSSTESEYTGLSYALREAIPIIELLKELKLNDFKIHQHTPKVFCKVFEDNSGAIEMAKEPKYRPRTKHINNKLHHFRSYVHSGDITIHKVGTDDQMADILTKPLPQSTFEKHRRAIMGW